MYRCEVLTVEEMKQELEDLKFKTKQKRFLDEQLLGLFCALNGHRSR